MQLARSIALFATGALGFSAGWWLHEPMATSSEHALVSVDAMARKLDSVEVAVADIKNRLSNRRDVTPGSAERVPEVNVAQGSQDTVLAAVDGLRKELAELRLQLTGGPVASDTDVAPVEKNVAALDTARASIDQDRNQSRLHHFGWSPLQVYRRYGLPDLSGNFSGTQIWGYSLSNDRAIYFLFDNGIVQTVSPFPPSGVPPFVPK
jgi:ribosomal protein L29